MACTVLTAFILHVANLCFCLGKEVRGFQRREDGSQVCSDHHIACELLFCSHSLDEKLFSIHFSLRYLFGMFVPSWPLARTAFLFLQRFIACFY